VATKLKDVGTVQDALDERDKLPPLNIAQRIAAVMGEVDYVQKEKKQGMNYSIVSHDAVTAKVRPLLHKHGAQAAPTMPRSSSRNGSPAALLHRSQTRRWPTAPRRNRRRGGLTSSLSIATFSKSASCLTP
jgi:hypothetical protein